MRYTQKGFNWEALMTTYAYLNGKKLNEAEFSYLYIFGEIVPPMSQYWLSFLEPAEYPMPIDSTE